jgi:hypothetical protein
VNPRVRRGRVSRRGRERHVKLRLLVAIAVGISSALMATLAAQAIVARASCNNHPLLVNVAVSNDISPAIERVAQLFNRQNHQAAGHCVEVEITEEAPAAVASQVDGQSSTNGMPAADAWIPDSTLWVDVARAFPLGAAQVQTTGVTVARSPLMIVMPAAAAAQIPAFNNSMGWNFLLPASDGGPSSEQQQLVRLELPDPTQSAAGLATMVEMTRLLGSSSDARTRLTKFVFSVAASAEFDDPASLAAFVALASPAVGGHPVTVTAEQAVIAYDAAHPGQPLAARYPTGSGAALGTPELDYPYVLTSTDPAEQAAATEFGKLLQQGYTAALVRYYGFRSASGVPGTIPASFALSQQPLQAATPASPSEAQTALQAWQRLQTGSRDLVLIDVSAAMDAPSGLGTMTVQQELTQVANLGLDLFPDSAEIGDWEFADNLSGGLPYKELVPVGPLPAEVGLITRRQQLQQINESVHPLSGTPAALDKTILAGYQQMVASYKPNFTNAVIVLTAGVDNAPGDLPVATLTSKLRALFNPDKPVELIILEVGERGNFAALQQIARAGDGAAYDVTNPTQVVKVFFAAVARRICATGACAVP